MDMELFTEGEPNNFNGIGEWCTLVQDGKIRDYKCALDFAPTAVCEVEVK